MAKRNTATELVPIRETGNSIALLEDLHDKAKAYAANAHSESTRRAYATFWGQFVTWAQGHGMPFLPASAATLVAYLTFAADGKQGAGKRGAYKEGHKPSKATLGSMLAAIKHYHRQHGHSLKETMDHPALKQLLSGVRRTIGQERDIRRVKPITAHDLRDMLEMLRPDVLREARDAAILAVGFGGCRRRSEVVGLNYLERDPKDKKCRGVLTVDERGVVIKLAVSKTNQSGSEEEYIIPRNAAPLLCQMTDNWIAVAKLKKGDPLFKGIRASGTSKRAQSGYPGVYWYKETDGADLWVALARTDGKQVNLGYFTDPEEAYLAYCKATGQEPQDKFSPHHLQGVRMDGAQVALIIKRRYKQLLEQRLGRKRPKPEELEAIAAQVANMSGHSMRVGHITSAAEAGAPVHHIQLSSGHKTASMISVYTRVSDKIGNSSLKGMKL